MSSIKSKAIFQEQWLTDKSYKNWVSKGKNNNYAKCVLCLKEIDLSTMGSAALDSHAKGARHKAKFKDRSFGLDVFFKQKPAEKPTEPQEHTSSSSKNLDSYVISDSTLNAEILWCLKVSTAHFSLRSCEGLGKLFKTMFPDSDFASKFSLGKTKCGYLINYGLKPYFREVLTKDINRSPFYSYSFDESMNPVLQNCQMDVVIRFWDEEKNCTQTRYLDSKFLNRPNANELLNNIYDSLSNLKEDRLLQLSMDGPTVNCKVLQLLDERLEAKDLPKTLNIGSCSQHTVHGGLKTGIKSVDWNIEKILKAMFWILHDSPARKDDYMREGNTSVFPLRYLDLDPTVGKESENHS